MFCVIQEIEKKKPNKNGYYKDLVSEWMQLKINGKDVSHYYHHYGNDRFERPVKKAYRISIHESYREGGRVKKRQFIICTVDYYDFADGSFTLYDWGSGRISKTAEALHIDEESLYEMIEKKIEPLEAQISAEYMQTEEYRVHAEHGRITTLYAARKVKFNEEYELDAGSNEYDRCYDVFGNLGRPDNLKAIKAAYKERKQYERRSQRKRRSYYEDFFNNYNTGSYSESVLNNHDAGNKAVLKRFYRELSKKFHPDSNPDSDTSEEMKVLNQLKQEWGI